MQEIKLDSEETKSVATKYAERDSEHNRMFGHFFNCFKKAVEWAEIELNKLFHARISKLEETNTELSQALITLSDSICQSIALENPEIIRQSYITVSAGLIKNFTNLVEVKKGDLKPGQLIFIQYIGDLVEGGGSISFPIPPEGVYALYATERENDFDVSSVEDIDKASVGCIWKDYKISTPDCYFIKKQA